MSKVLLTNHNSAWGVIVRPQSPNSYRHIISFDKLSDKEAFIQKKLFPNEQEKWTDIIKKQPEQAIYFETATTATIKINPKDYLGKETFYSLLNKDFAIVLHEGQTLYYTLTGTREGSIIKYTAELDIFMTYDIKDMFRDTPVTIDRAHTDRYKIENGSVKMKHLKNFPKGDLDKYKESIDNNNDPIFSGEEFDNGITSDMMEIISTERVENSHSLKKIFDDGNGSYIKFDSSYKTELEKSNAFAKLAKLKFEKIVLNKKSDGKDPDGLSAFEKTAHSDKYLSYVSVEEDKLKSEIIYLIGLSHIQKYECNGGSCFSVDYVNQGSYNIYLVSNSDDREKDITEKLKANDSYIGASPWASVHNFIGDPNVVESSYGPLPLNPIYESLGGKNPGGFLYFYTDINGEKCVNYYSNAQNSAVIDNFDFNMGNNIIAKKPKLMVLSTARRENYEVSQLTKPFPKELYNPRSQLEFYGNKLSKDSIVTNIHPYEVKKYFAPYRKFKLLSGSPSQKSYSPQLFYNNDEITLELNSLHMVNKWSYAIAAKNYDLLYNFSFGEEGHALGQRIGDTTDYRDGYLPGSVNNATFIDIYDYTEINEKSAWNEYIVRNKNSEAQKIETQAVNAAVDVAASGLGIGASLASGNIFGAIGGIFGIGNAVKNSINVINQQKAKFKDLKNSPDDINFHDSAVFKDIQYKNIYPQFAIMWLNHKMLTHVAEFFYKFGYNFESKLWNINKLLKTRYYFNYIKAPGLFENIKLNLSADIKQQINDTLAEGVTIWHCRDIDEFVNKGIKNYTYENMEISIMKHWGEI